MLANPTIPMNENNSTINNKVLFTWIAVMSSTMMFAGLTSAYIVSSGEAGRKWLEFGLPSFFLVSTFIVSLSSLSLYWAFISAKKDNITQLKYGIILAIILGFVFLGTQLMAYSQMIDNKLYLVSNVSISFVYMISLFHAGHILLGITLLFIVLYKTSQLTVHSKNMTAIKVVGIFWHFLTVLWIYLYLFLSFYK